MNQKLNELMAVKVMEFGTTKNNYWYTRPKKQSIEYVMPITEWTPTTNHQQAWECEEELKNKMPELIHEYITELIIVTANEFLEGHDKYFQLKHATPLQICQAIAQVVEE